MTKQMAKQRPKSTLAQSQSGGIDVSADEVNVGADVVGRDKVTNIFNAIGGFLSDRDLARDRRNQLVLLDKVDNYWIKGVLERSVHSRLLIELGKEIRSDLVTHPWDILVDTGEPDGHYISQREVGITNVFEESDQSLLILGAPGSGKTTTLLMLARDLIEQARNDPANPLPVVFNLSSWSRHHMSLADWLISELSEKYQVPTKIGRKWVIENSILPLLDGLDEVISDQRDACITAINAFRQEYGGLTGLVVCSRTEEYLSLKTQLKLGGAILIQPLTDLQIDKWLEAAGSSLAGLRVSLGRDPTLRELAQSPLMLSIMGITFNDMPVDVSLSDEVIEERRRILFNRYIQRMLRRGLSQRSSSVSMPYWLSYIAQKMTDQRLSLFSIEELQPNWLPDQASIQTYWFISRLLEGMILVELSLIGGNGPLFSLLWGLLFAFIIFGSVSQDKDITPTESFRWSWLKAVKSGPLMLPVAVIAGAVVELLYAAIEHENFTLTVGRVLYFWALLTIGNGLEMSRLDIKLKARPNQGIWLSLTNSMRIGFFVALVSSAILSLTIGTNYFSLILILTPFAAFAYGGRAFVRHFVLRFVLSSDMPFNIVYCLDDAVECVFLQRIGNSYAFVHRMLQDHFAALNSDI
jgi:DNA polymerase III delta prime subunit